MASTSTTDRQAMIDITNAFEEIAPPSASTSATFSAPLQMLPCDIFINHRGPDVKYTFARAIYKALHAMGLRVFLDSEELELGDFLPAALQEAMRRASLHVAIFSPGYAQSPWCLAELSFMLKSGTPIIPVFYRVQPTDLRWVAQGKGMYVNAFSQHQEKGRYSLEKLQEWKTALYNVSLYNGEIINNHDDEQWVLKNIVNRALKVMKTVPLEVAKYPVGLEEAVADFEMTLSESVKAHPNVQVVGIWGMGGSGKTTLAKELYNQKCSSVQKASFLFDVRDAVAKSELHKKQIQLLQDLGFQDKPYDSVEQGKMILSNHLRSVSVIIILDDIDHIDQLEALLPAKNSLGWGSLIIVTTREKEILISSGISSIYKMKTLNPFHAKQLFCWHAFLQPSPLIELEELVEKFLSVCNGLPLSLKVLGGQLYGCSTKDLWEDILQKISKILPNDIKNRLRVSYDALDEEEKQMFLDVACFFIGKDKMIAIAVWDGSGWSGLYGWERLVNKCLVDFDDNNNIRMHDHLRDLGREIAKTQAPGRLWFPDQITSIQKQTEIRGMLLNAASSGVHKFPARLYGLKVFVVGENYGNNLHIVKSSKELAWLSCTGIVHRDLPPWLPFKNLRVLELHRCQNIVGLWKDGVEAPVQLRVLIVDGCRSLARVPNSIGYLQNLKKMSLSGCNVEGLPKQFCRLQSLEHLELDRCQMLSSLPSSFGHLTNLRHLDLSFCHQLKMLPDSFKQLKLLQYLSLEECKMLTLKSDILENMAKLEHLNLYRCTQLEQLPLHITNQASLSELYVKETRLREFPINIGQLSKLRVLKISSEERCFQIQSLPDSMGSLNLLERLELENLEVESLPKSLKQLTNLQTLKIIGCPITELDFGRGSFTSSLCNLKEIVIAKTRVSKISISEDCCPGLTTLSLWNNDHLTMVDTLPTTVEDIVVDVCLSLWNIIGIGGVVNLRKLTLSNCPKLNTLPSFDKLASLKVCVLFGGNNVEKIQGLQQCTSMERLNCTFWEVPHIGSLEHMQRLKRLVLVAKKRTAVEHCIQTLQNLPEEIVICTEAVPGAGSLLNSSAFPNLSVLHSIAHMAISCEFSHLVRLPQKRSSSAKAIMLCLLINCITPRMPLFISGEYANSLFATEVDEGKWIWIGVFTQHSRCPIAQDLCISQMPDCTGSTESDLCNNHMEKGFLVKGEEHSVMEAFHRLLALLGRANVVGRDFQRLLKLFDKENSVVKAFHHLFNRLLSLQCGEDGAVEGLYHLLALLGKQNVEAFQRVLVPLNKEHIQFWEATEDFHRLMATISKEDINRLLALLIKISTICGHLILKISTVCWHFMMEISTAFWHLIMQICAVYWHFTEVDPAVMK